MKTNTILLIGGLAIAGYMLYRQSQKDKLAGIAAQSYAATSRAATGAASAIKSETEAVLEGTAGIIETTGEQLAKFFG